MPSPVGHALGGVTAGWTLAPSRSVKTVGWLAAVGAAADLDLVIGAHRGPTHSIGAAALTFLLVWMWTRNLRWALAAAAAWGSHVLLDWLGTDTSAPVGEMALWPYSRGYFESRLHLFPAISRRYGLPEFWVANLKALAIELVILGPMTWAVIRTSGLRKTTRPGGRRA